MRQSLLTVLLLTFTPLAVAATHDVGKSDPERKVFLEALRPTAEADVAGKPVLFLVATLRANDTFAFVAGKLVQPDGKPFNYRGTKYQARIADGTFDDHFEALLARRDGKWIELAYVNGATYLAWGEWDKKYGAPHDVLYGVDVPVTNGRDSLPVCGGQKKLSRETTKMLRSRLTESPWFNYALAHAGPAASCKFEWGQEGDPSEQLESSEVNVTFKDGSHLMERHIAETWDVSLTLSVPFASKDAALELLKPAVSNDDIDWQHPEKGGETGDASQNIRFHSKEGNEGATLLMRDGKVVGIEDQGAN